MRSLLALGVLVAALLPAAAQEPFARTRLDPGAEVTVGQPVRVTVEVLVPTWFTGAPQFPDLDLRDAIVIFEDRGVNFTEPIEGSTWAGQSRSYVIYPQRPGDYRIDAIPVALRYNSEDAGPRAEATATPPPVRFEAVVPPEAEGLPYFISSSGLEIEQSFDREPGTMLVGEAFTRTITVTVRDALSMVLPPLPSEPIPGLAVYAEPPVVKDSDTQRGGAVVGTRIEQATFVAEEEGDYTLPAVEISWWDVDEEKLAVARLTAIELRVDPNPEALAAIPLPDEDPLEEGAESSQRRRVSLIGILRQWGPPLALLLVLGWIGRALARRYLPAIRQRLEAARERQRESESAAFAELKRVADSGDAKATWNAWSAWLDRIHEGAGCRDDPCLRRGCGRRGAGPPARRARRDALHRHAS